MSYLPPWQPPGGTPNYGPNGPGGPGFGPNPGSGFGPNQSFGPNFGQQYPPGAPFGSPGYGEAPPLDGPPPNRNKTPFILAAIAVVAVLAIAVTALMWRLNSGDSSTVDTAATSTTAVPTTSSTKTKPPKAAPAPKLDEAAPCEASPAQPASQTPAGWSTVTSPRGLAYDAPAGWEVLSCTTLIGWEKPCADGPFGYCPIRMMSGAAVLNNTNPSCKVTVADAGTPGAKNVTDINQAVQLESQTVADIYTSDSGVVPQVSLSAPRNVTVAGRPGVQILATVTGIEADDCHSPSALHSMVATTVPGQEGTVLFVVALSQGIPGAPDAGVIDQMIGTLRDAPKA